MEIFRSLTMRSHILINCRLISAWHAQIDYDHEKYGMERDSNITPHTREVVAIETEKKLRSEQEPELEQSIYE